MLEYCGNINFRTIAAGRIIIEQFYRNLGYRLNFYGGFTPADDTQLRTADQPVVVHGSYAQTLSTLPAGRRPRHGTTTCNQCHPAAVPTPLSTGKT